MTVNQPLTIEDKHRKLLQISLYKRWNAQLFLKFWNQLQESAQTDATDSNTNTNSVSLLFQAIDNNYLDPLFLEYLSCLALDPKSLSISAAGILDYIQSCSLNSKHVLLIFLAKSTNNLPAIPANVEDIIKSLTKYMSKMESSSPEEIKAVGFFLAMLGRRGLGDSPVFSSLKNSSIFDSFDANLAKFIVPLEALDNELAKELKEVYRGQKKLDSTRLSTPPPSSPATLKLSRVFRMLYLEKIMMSSCLIQGDKFYHELEILLAGEPPKVVIEELITSAFDCLAAAMQRQDPPKYITLWSAFMTKRIPHIIQHFAKDIPANQIDSVVCRPITLLDRGTISQISGGQDALDDMFSSFPPTTIDIRTHFLQTCINQKIISPESLKSTLGNDAMASESTINQCAGTDRIPSKDNPQESIKISDFFSEKVAPENPDHVLYEEGNLLWLVRTHYEELDGIGQYTVAEEILKLIHKWTSVSGYSSRSVARLCQVWAENTGALDMLVLHISPTDILAPLIAYLDDWKEDEEEEANFQDHYADFGSIFIFILQVHVRYGLGSDLNTSTPGDAYSFCTQQLQRYSEPDGAALCNSPKSLEDLSEDQKDLVGGWISALFNGDGISDDLMRMSSIQVLINLVPIIFQQVIRACDRKIIEMDILKSGLDYFRQPFLAPTVIGAMQYLYQAVWETQSITPAQQVILQELLLPSDRSPDAKRVHDSVIFIMAKPLQRVITNATAATVAAYASAGDLLRRTNRFLSEHIVDSRRSVVFGPESMSLVNIIKDHLTGLSSWSMSASNGKGSPPLCNIDVFKAAIRFFGRLEAAGIILDELDLADSQGGFNVTLDVAASLLIAAGDQHFLDILSTPEYEDIVRKEREKSNKNGIQMKGYNQLRNSLCDLRERFKHSSHFNKTPVAIALDKKDSVQQVSDEQESFGHDPNDISELHFDNGMGMQLDDDPLAAAGLDLDVGLGDDLFGPDMDMN